MVAHWWARQSPLARVSERLANGTFQLGRAGANEVCQVGILRVAPARLHRIEFRGICRKEFEVEVPPAKSTELRDQVAKRTLLVKGQDRGRADARELAIRRLTFRKRLKSNRLRLITGPSDES